MSIGAAIILERAAHIARSGQRDPHRALILAGDYPANVDPKGPPLDPAELEALLALLSAIGTKTLVEWMEVTNPTPNQTAELLEEVLFLVQLGG